MSDQPWRLYRPEWVTVHTVTASGTGARPCLVLAQEWVTKNFEGQIRDQDLRFIMYTDTKLLFWCHIEVFKNNLKGEFKYAVAADNYARRNDFDEYIVVQRNSEEDQKIRSHGVSRQ